MKTNIEIVLKLKDREIRLSADEARVVHAELDALLKGENDLQTQLDKLRDLAPQKEYVPVPYPVNPYPYQPTPSWPSPVQPYRDWIWCEHTKITSLANSATPGHLVINCTGAPLTMSGIGLP